MPIVFAIVSFVTILALYKAYVLLPKLRLQMKTLMHVQIAHTFVTWVVVVIVFAEGGAYAAANLFLLLAQILLFRTLFITLKIVTLPTYAVLGRDSTRWVRWLTTMEVFFDSLEAAFLIWAMAESYRAGDNGPYNLAMTCFLFTMGFSQVALIATGIFQARRLLQMLRKSAADLMNHNMQGDSKFKPVMYQLEEIVRSGPVILSTFLTFFAFPIVFLILGSFPYQIVLFSMIHVFAALFHMRTCMVLENKFKFADGSGQSAPSATSKNDSATAKNEYDSAISPATGGGTS
jgi:hypothetical protein